VFLQKFGDSDAGKRSPLPRTLGRSGYNDHPATFLLLPPGKAIRVHASTRFAVKPGPHSFTAHAELLTLSGGRSEGVGTAESIPVSVRFSIPAAQ
jgi:hypothetical protein